MAKTKSNTASKPSPQLRKDKHSGLQLAGLFLWRFGLLLAGATALYNAIEFILRFVDFPLQIEIGVGLALAGVVCVAISFIIERIRDYRAEGDLTHDADLNKKGLSR